MLTWQEAALYESDGSEYPKAEKPEPKQPDSDTAELAAWLAEQTWSEFAQSLASFYRTRGYLTDKQIASAQKMRTKCEARQASRKKAIDTDGLYEKDGVIFKVQYAVNGSGNLYAKRLVVLGEGEAEWQYEGRKPLYELTEDDRLTEEQARKFGRLYGVCAICGRTLTDEGSIADGIGPVCAGKAAW